MARPFTLFVMLVTLTAAAAEAATVDLARVRIRDRGVRRLFDSALDRSPTLQQLVRALHESDVIVYVELQPFLPDSLPAGITFIGTGGGYRYLRVALNPSNTRRQMFTMLGHELQHAVEIAMEPSVQSRDTLEAHFTRIGRRGEQGWDTDAARDTGRTVGREAVAGIALATSYAKRSVQERE